ncbi:MAG: sugar O-acetyltransferase [Clostridia bacterium]
MTEKEKMLAGKLYSAHDPELRAMHARAVSLTEQLNSTPYAENDRRKALVRELFGTSSENINVESEFRCDYGINIHVGDGFFANYGCVILDVCEIHIGTNCLIAPQVGIYTATHPTDAATRIAGLECGQPITIGDNCWIGGHATILPGVTLGDNVVVAAGAVVTKSFPDNVVIGGNPARIIKHLD